MKGNHDINKGSISGWIAYTIRLAYKNLSKSKVALLKIKAHELRALSASWSYFNKTPVEDVIKAAVWSGLPLGGRTPYITSKNRLRTPKLHIRDVPRTSENSLVRPKMDIETSCLQKKTRPHLPDYVIYVPPSCWKLIYFVY